MAKWFIGCAAVLAVAGAVLLVQGERGFSTWLMFSTGTLNIVLGIFLWRKSLKTPSD